MYERYSGSFLSVSGVEWKAMILQEADSEFAPVGGLTFVSGSEIEIEWPHKDKEEVVCGSTATVTLLSPGDRTYADLYTIAPGKIKLEVYRDGSLYWAGLLDPEFSLYFEPERGRGTSVDSQQRAQPVQRLRGAVRLRERLRRDAHVLGLRYP